MAELRKANITGVRPTDINSPEAQTGLSMDQIIVRAMGGIEGKLKITTCSNAYHPIFKNM